ncbi:unnamed protein product, partial [Coregonus sp. 'balchen']
TISYTWTLYLVNSSSKVDTDVPFCHSVDLSIPSNIIGGPTFPLPPALTLTPPSSPPHTPSPTASMMSSSTEISSKMTSSNTNAVTSIPASLVTGLVSSNGISHTEIQTTTPTTPGPVPLSPLPPLPTIPLPLPSPSPGDRPQKQRSQGSVELQRINSTAGNNQTPNYTPPFLSLPNHTVLANPSKNSSPEPISAPISSTPDTPEPDVGRFDPAGPPYPISEYPVVVFDDGRILYSAPLGQSDIFEEFPIDPDFPADYDFPFPVLESGDVSGRPVEGSSSGESVSGGVLGPFPGPGPSTAETSWDPNGTLGPSGNQTGSYNFTDYNVPFLGIEEGDPGVSGGRPTGVGGGSSGSSEGDSAPAIPGSGEDEGSNLMDSSPSLVVLDPTLLDLPRELLEQERFESYTYTGISSALIMFRPFTLRAGSRYMLEVTANSHDAVLGRTQLFLSTSPTPRGMTCQVQPSSGLEIHTHFSIFCTSGKESLSIQRSGTGLEQQLYPVLVEIRNYIILLSSVLNRLSQDPTANTHTQTHTRTTLINAVCQLDINDQGSMIDNIYMLKDLMHLTHQVSLASASVVVGHVQSISDLFHQPTFAVPYILDSWTLNTLVTLLSYSLQATPTTDDVRQDQATADDTTHHDHGLTTVISSGSATFYLPDSLDLVLYGRRGRETADGPQSLCVLSQLTTFTHNLYFWTKTPELLSGPVIDLTLYNCSTRREIPVRSLSQPINIEFPKTPRNVRIHFLFGLMDRLPVSSVSEFTLLRSQVNYHSFNITQQAVQEAILVSVEFTRPPNKTFPIMLLFSLPSDVTVVCVCVVCVCLYALGMVVCKRADLILERNQGVYYLSDNGPSDTHLYSVTIHTGLRSSTSMTAKVHIVLYGEDGASQTRQLYVPECPLFRRNSRNTFILSTVDSLGPLWGLNLWHDNTGPSPTWYLRQVEVCEVKGKGRRWLFLGQCWLAVDEGDGQLLYLKLSEYLSDFHLWLSVYSGPSPSMFTHTQRLSLCLLLLLGYMSVNTLLISGLEDQYTSELGIIDVSAVSLTTGLLSALAVLPVATALSFLFRQREGSVPNRDLVTQRGDLGIWSSQDLVRDLLTEEKVSSDCNSIGFEDGVAHDNSLLGRLLGNNVPDNNSIRKERDRNLNDSPKLLGNNQVGTSTSRCLGGRLNPLPRWSHLLAWVLCLALGLSSLVVIVVLGIRLILAMAVVVSFWRRKRPDFSSFSGATGFQAETLKLWTQDGSCVPELFMLSPPHQPQERCSHFDRVLAARQRARYLRLVRPPTSGELRRTGGRKRRETLIRKTLRKMAVCFSMLFLLLCVTYGSSSRDQYHLNHAVRTQFTR